MAYDNECYYKDDQVGLESIRWVWSLDPDEDNVELLGEAKPPRRLAMSYSLVRVESVVPPSPR
jgi:hypothetical protein